MADQILTALKIALHHYGEEARNIFPEKTDLSDQELLDFTVNTLIRFFSGKNQAWLYLAGSIRSTLIDLADPEAASGSLPDIRAKIDETEKEKIITGLQKLSANHTALNPPRLPWR